MCQNANQLGRNLSPDDFKIVSGRIYNRRKKQGERNDLTSRQVDDKLSTSDVIANELGTSARTIERNGQRAELHDEMVACGDTAAARSIR